MGYMVLIVLNLLLIIGVIYWIRQTLHVNNTETESYIDNPTLTNSFKDYSSYFSHMTGLEIGGPSLFFKSSGIYSAPAKLDNINFAHDTLWSTNVSNSDYIFEGKTIPGKTYISDIVNLGIVKDKTYDFVFASHVLEHVVNPLKAIGEITRVLKDNGICVLILPWKEETFDHKRPISKFSKLLENYNTNRDEVYIDDYLPEVRQYYDLSRDLPAGTMDQFLARCKDNYINRGLHVHVFDFDLIVQCLRFFKYDVLDMQLVKPYHQTVLAKKTMD